MWVIIIFGILFVISSILTLKSLKGLSHESNTYYDFGKIISHGGMWTIGIYVIGIIFLVAILLFFAKLGLKAPSA